MVRAERDRRDRIFRAAIVGVILACVVPFGAGAGAEQTKLQPNPTGYYTKTQDPFRVVSGPIGEAACSLPSPDPRTCINPAQLTGGTPGNPRQDNYIYVAAVNGDDDSHGVIGIPLFSVPLGSTITSLVLDFYVENEAAAGTLNFDPEAPALQFCIITEGWAGQDAAPYDSQPDSNCEASTKPKLIRELTRTETTDEGAPLQVNLVLYSVDLMPMARKWATGSENHGVMVRPTPDAPRAYQVAIRTPAIAPDGMTLRVGYTPGPPPVVPTIDPPLTDEPAASFGGDEAPAAPEPEPTFDLPEPSTAPEGQPLAAGEPVSTGTPWWTFLGLPLGLAVLAGMSRGLSEPLLAADVKRAGPVSRLMNRAR